MRLLVIRTDRLGDTVLTLPGVMALKKALPDAQIDMCCSPGLAPLVDCCSAVSEVLPWKPEFSGFAVVLCGPGVALDDELITRLMLRGIKRIDVEGTPLPPPPRGSGGETIAILQRRFSRTEPTDFMQNLQRMVAEIIEGDG